MFVNQLLKTTRNGRKFLVDGKPLDLNLPFDTINKHLVNHFDFKKEIKTYYLQVKCAQSLIKQLNAIASGTNAKISVSVLDETFFVSLRVNARSLETLKNEKLPVEFRSRRVVYQSSKLPAELIFIKRIISRATPPKEIHTITMPSRSLPMHRISPQSPAQPKIARIPKPRPTGSTMEPNKLPTKPKFTSFSEPMRILDSSSLPMEFTVEELRLLQEKEIREQQKEEEEFANLSLSDSEESL
jgi:hypothetical protein